jgi:hypothetical protein
MALRFEAEATSLVGIQWRLRIYDSAYGGATVLPFKVGGDIFELAYDGADDDRVQYIIPSQLTFTYIIESATQEELVDNLKTAKEGRYLLEVEYLDTTYQPYWRGVLFADQVEVADEYYPQQVRLTASDDLKALDSIPYKVSDTVPYTGLSSLGSHLINCINKVRWISLNSGTRTTFEDFFRSTQQATPVVTAATAIAIEHHGLYTISDNGNAEYPSTYEVLAEILSLMGLRLFQVNGAFMTQSIFACEADVANAKLTTISSSAVGSTTTVARTTFSPGANYVKERGWAHGYLHPLSEVNRKYNFTGVIYYGYIQIYNSGADLLTGTTETLSTFADNSFQQNDIASLRFRLRLAWAGNGALSGDNRLVRHKVIVTWKMGQYYLARTAIINSSNLTEYPVPGIGQPTASVVNYSYNAPSWSTSSSNRVEFMTPPLNMLASGSWEGEFGIEGPPFAADLSSNTSTAAFDMVAVLSTGSTSTAYDSQFSSVSNTWQRQQVLFVQLLPGDTTAIEGQEATYRAINDDDNGRAVLELPETRIGDKLAENQNHLLKALDGSAAYVPTETWYTDDDATTRSIHRLGCVEMLSGQNRTVPTQFGTLHERPATTVPGIRMHHLFVDDAQYHALFAFTYSAYMNSYDISMWKLDRELTNISVPDIEYFGDPTGPTWGPGGLPAAQIEALQVADTVTDATVGVMDGKLALVFDTVRPKSSGYATTSITYEAGQTDGMVVEIDQQTVQLKSASGNSYYSLTESSPGQMRFVLQDDVSPTPNSVNCMQIDAGSNKGFVGINQPAPVESLDVIGNIKLDGNIIVGGTVDGVDVAARDIVLTDLNDHALLDILIYNNTGSTLTKGTVVREDGAVSGPPSALKAAKFSPVLAILDIYGHRILGVLTTDVLNGAYGYARPLGFISGIDTNAFNVGSLLYASDTTPGALSLAVLTLGYYDQRIGWCTKKSSTAGEIYVRIDPKQYAFAPVALPSPPPGGYKSVLFQDSAGEQTYDTQFTYTDSTNTLSIGGTTTTAGVLRLGEASNNGTNSIGIQAPATLAADTTYTLPSADGTSGQLLSTNASGTLSWVTRAANSFETIAVAGQSNVVADSGTDTLTLAAGTGITITTNDTTDTVTITSSVTAPNTFGTIAVAGQNSVVADSTTDTLTLTAGTGITITTDDTTDTVTITNSVTAPNTFGTIAVAGQSNVVADSTTDTLTLVAGTGITITTDATTDTVTINTTRKATQVTGKTVATGAWSLVSGFYEASISDAGISATSIVDVIPDNGSAATAATAGVLPRTDSSSGAVKIYATATPAATLTVTINIFDL